MKKYSIFLLIFFISLLMLVVQREVVGAEEYAGIDTCKGCHEDKFEGFIKGMHGKKENPRTPAAKEGCESCHGSGVEHANAGGGKGVGGIFSFDKKLDANDKSAKCLSCHGETKNHAFWDLSKHKSEGVSCSDCHSIHSGREKYLKQRQPDLCFGCHRDIKAQTNKQAHHPIREGKVSCSDCHDVHGEFSDKMIKADSVNELCYKCHADKRGPFLWEHAPVEENCLNCHTPHGSNHESLLVSKMPYLCQNCHTGSGHPRVPYGPFDSSFTGATGTPPTGVTQRPKYIVRSCVNCHINIHGSDGPVGATNFGREQGKRFAR
jgi:DmsE family decaheme c-type cytochrome